MNTKKMSFSLVLSDVNQAHEISRILKSKGIVTYYYDSLGSYWRDSLIELPEFSIIDVKCMSSGDLLLKNHPRVKDGKLKLAFFHTDETKILLGSTYGIHNYGVINSANELDGQIKSVLTRLENEIELKEQSISNEETILRLKNRTARLVEDISEYKMREDAQKEILDLAETLELKVKMKSFNEALAATLSDWKKVLGFSLYELNATNQKMVSPVLKLSHYHELPALWLGQIAKDGIGENARNLSVQVAIDQFGLEVLTLPIQGSKRFPDLMVYLQVDKNDREMFPWELLSKLISGIYNRYKIFEPKIKNENQKEESLISSWELLDRVDEAHFNLEAEKFRLIDVNFQKLVDGIKSRPKLRFFWKSFYTDFNYELKKTVKMKYWISECGPYHMHFLVPSEVFDDMMMKLEDFVIRFSYWRYFEDTTQVLTLNLIPKVKEIPLTSISYLNHVENGFDDVDRAVQIAATQAKKIFQGIQIPNRKLIPDA
jgi:hypothetical protein